MLDRQKESELSMLLATIWKPDNRCGAVMISAVMSLVERLDEVGAQSNDSAKTSRPRTERERRLKVLRIATAIEEL